MNELELTKMLFYYETTVGAFESENVLDLFSHYYGEMPGEKGFNIWVKEANVENEWEEYLNERGIDK